MRNNKVVRLSDAALHAGMSRQQRNILIEIAYAGGCLIVGTVVTVLLVITVMGAYDRADSARRAEIERGE